METQVVTDSGRCYCEEPVTGNLATQSINWSLNDEEQFKSPRSSSARSRWHGLELVLLLKTRC